MPVIPTSFSTLVLGVALLATTPLAGQGRAANDGFQRRDGSMYVIRNGVKRPMTRDVHLPNGRVITRDGFVVERDGHRTELREGNGCDLVGTTTAVTPGANGQLVLAAAARPQPVASAEARAVSTDTYLRQLLGNGKHRGGGRYKKNKHGKGKRHKNENDD
ncbi:DUF6799 domain-containing protein [Hymenobacter elongatus]|uniref:DUF6799 domain-containing protein n=1 Tax=Hymenobacter elongatus TaxID=877208 RepID=A0A4Z0PK24_9BACT|nr:DUF6799 domain-containing protein [Hymenobacter elongatus]TGE15933.1 hypothetical protein E5J99_10895 [Hymenobacter elongatus]